jgi:hypothetical protein
MKIAFVMPFHISERGGGAEVQTWLFSKELAKRNYEVHYICRTLIKKTNLSENIDGVTVHWLKYKAYFEFLSAPDYYKALKRINPDFIIQRVASFTTGIIGRYKKKFKKKFIWICAENSIPYKLSATKKQIKSTKGFLSSIKSIPFYVNALLTDISKNYGIIRADFCFTQNETQEELIKKNFAINSFRILTGHIPATNINSPEKRIIDKIILWTANLGPRKRPELFFNLAEKLVNTDYKFIMIGSRSDSSYMIEMSQKISPNVTMLGKQSFDDTLDWFNKAFVFVNTSTPEGEGFPNTYIQAWFRGVPVLTLSVDPNDVIKKHKLGFVCQTIEEIIDKIILLSSDKVLYYELYENAKFYAMKYHNLSTVVDDFCNKIFS